MIAATVRRWSAWSPGLEDADAWSNWCAAPTELAVEGRPDAQFLPAMLRRRCGALSRIMLTAAFDCCEEVELARVATVFASRHGNINASINLLDRLAERQPLSPTAFSHTVHNAQAGLFSIAAENRRASSSIAAQQDSFACGYLEALTLLERDPDQPVLLVVGDVPLAPTFAPLVEEPAGSYGLGLLLARDGEGTELSFGRQPEANGPEPACWPDAIEFLRWYLSDESSLVLGSTRRPWKWERVQ
jgi:hypothetical protein